MSINGTSGDDNLVGTSGDDIFDMGQGGNDTASGGGGNDTFNLGASLAAGDVIDGGAGVDTVVLNGDYNTTQLSLDSTLLQNIEKIRLTAGHSYHLVFYDGAIASGQSMTINGTSLGVADTLTVDGGYLSGASSGATIIAYSGAGSNYFTGGPGSNVLHGGSGSDYVYFGSNFGTNDKIDGGGGYNILYLTGDYSAGLTLSTSMMQNIQDLRLEPGYSYKIISSDGNVASGATMTIDGSYLGPTDSFTFNGSHETDGSFHFDIGPGAVRLIGGAGGDIFETFANEVLTASDHLDGGAGQNILYLTGDYSAGLNLEPGTLLNIAYAQLSPGFSYKITTNDATVAAGQTMTFDARNLGSTDIFTFNGSHETDGNFNLEAGAGNDVLTGSAGNDSFDLSYGGNDIANGGAGNDTYYMFAALNAGDKIDGGTGNDTVIVNGDYSAGVTLGAQTLVNVETLQLAANFNYKFIESDGNVAAGQTLKVDGSALIGDNTLTFNGGAETDGRFSLLGGSGNDVLKGGAGNDVLKGDLGADSLTGNGGADHYVYGAAAQSSSTNYDTITGFDFSADKFDIVTAVNGIDTAITTGTLRAADFDSDLAAAMSGHLDPLHAILFTPDAGSLAGQTFLIVDVNNSAGYQANGDLVIHLAGATGTLTTSDFI